MKQMIKLIEEISPDLNVRCDYAEKELGLQLVGIGSARSIYKLSGGRVLKLPRDEKGLAQNKTEGKLFSKDSVLAKVIEFAKDGSWLVMEQVKEVKGSGGFEKASGGLPWLSFTRAVVKMWNDLFNGRVVEFRGVPAPLILSVYSLMKNHGIPLGEFMAIEHWGMSKTGKLVLMDYGTDKEVVKTFYPYIPTLP